MTKSMNKISRTGGGVSEKLLKKREDTPSTNVPARLSVINFPSNNSTQFYQIKITYFFTYSILKAISTGSEIP